MEAYTIFLVIVFILLIIVHVVNQYINIRLKYKRYYDWWYQNDGKKYDKIFNLTTLFSSEESNLFYLISKTTTGTPINNLSLPMYRFLIQRIFPTIRLDLNGKQLGVLTPKHLCQTIALDDTDDKFYDWRLRKNRSINIIAEYVSKEYTIQKNGKNQKGIYFVLNNDGVYPSASGIITDKLAKNWAGLMSEWLNGPKPEDGKPPKWIYIYNDEDKGHQWVPNPDLNDDDPTSLWYDFTENGHNPFSRMTIEPDSKIIAEFFSGGIINPDNSQDFVSFINLFLSDQQDLAGGWLGWMLNNSSRDTSYWQTAVSIESKRKNGILAPCKRNPDGKTQSILSTTVSTGMNAVFGMGVVASATGPLGWIVGGILALVVIFQAVSAGYSANSIEKGDCEK